MLTSSLLVRGICSDLKTFSRIHAEDMKGEDMYKIFRTPVHYLGSSPDPDYLLYAGKLYPTATHPRGWSESPDYEMRADGKIYRAEGHPLGAGNVPDYTIGPDCLFYRSDGHPDGPLTSPEYELRELAT
jgi:hypothetical protein